jgi:tRNA A37 N6-isopentenylltransferase MiaA
MPPGPPGQQNFRTFQLRQELVLTAARHDAPLAYQLLAATRLPANLQTPDARGPRAQLTTDENLEQTLLGRIAFLDPKLAAQNAEQMLDKGQFPMTLGQVIDQLYRQDPDAAEKFADKAVKKIQAANILAKNDAGGLIQLLLRGGPRPPAATESTSSTAKPQSTGSTAVLGQTAYVDLLSTIVDLGLKATPATQNTPRPNQPNQRRIGPNAGPTSPQQPTDAQIEQQNARRLLAGLQVALPYIDQYLPSKAPLVRQKMSEVGLSNVSPMNFAQTLQGQPTTDALVQAAATAPSQMQSRLYQQAANKALEDGDIERARQIANDHLQNNARDAVMQRIDFREMAKKAEGARLDEIRQIVARLPTEGEKVDLLVQLATDVQQSGNQKLAVQLLEEAKQLVNRRATRYEHFNQQLKVAHAFALVDPTRSFELLDPGISQLNELLSAAALLSGFEINMFRDGEMAIQGGNGLTATINRYGQELAVLARNDFERSETLAGRFQFPEPRIMTRLAIVQGLLGVKPVAGARTLVGNFGDSIVIRPE